MAHDRNRYNALPQVHKVLDTLGAYITYNKPFKVLIGTDFGTYAVYCPQVVTSPEGDTFTMAHAITKEAGKPVASYDEHTERELRNLAKLAARRRRHQTEEAS